MEAQDFCYWLQGFFELSEDKTLTPKQTQIIKDHLQSVFNKQTPDRSEMEKISISPNFSQFPEIKDGNEYVGPGLFCSNTKKIC